MALVEVFFAMRLSFRLLGLAGPALGVSRCVSVLLGVAWCCLVLLEPTDSQGAAINVFITAAPERRSGHSVGQRDTVTHYATGMSMCFQKLVRV